MVEKRQIHLSIIAPFYNEAEGVKTFYKVLDDVVANLGISVDFIFVDDGSRDKTLEQLQDISQTDERLTILSFARNFGHQAALTAGIDYARGDVIIMMDSDLQHPPNLIPEMLNAYYQGVDIVYAVRRESQSLGWFKRASATWYYVLLEKLGTVPVVRGAADFRLMTAQSINELRHMREQHRYLRGMVSWMGFKSDIIYYDQPDRVAGVPTYTVWKSFQLARHGLLSFSTIPLELITLLGMIITFISVIYLVFIVITSLLGLPVEGWSSLIATILILGGVQLISIGVIAQYIGMIFEEVKKRPLYIIQEKHLSAFTGESLSDSEK